MRYLYFRCSNYGRFVDTTKKQAVACFFDSNLSTYSPINQRPENVSVVKRIQRPLTLDNVSNRSWSSGEVHLAIGTPRRRSPATPVRKPMNVGCRATFLSVATSAMGRDLPGILANRMAAMGLEQSLALTFSKAAPGALPLHIRPATGALKPQRLQAPSCQSTAAAWPRRHWGVCLSWATPIFELRTR